MVVFGALAGILVAVPLGAILGALGMATERIELYGQLVGYLVAIPVGIWSVKHVLSKEFREFRVVLLPSQEKILEEQLGSGRE